MGVSKGGLRKSISTKSLSFETRPVVAPQDEGFLFSGSSCLQKLYRRIALEKVEQNLQRLAGFAFQIRIFVHHALRFCPRERQKPGMLRQFRETKAGRSGLSRPQHLAFPTQP